MRQCNDTPGLGEPCQCGTHLLQWALRLYFLGSGYFKIQPFIVSAITLLTKTNYGRVYSDLWFKKGSSPSWQGRLAANPWGSWSHLSTPGSRERWTLYATHFLFIQPGTSGHGRVLYHIGWVFLPLLTNLEASSQTSPGNVFQVIICVPIWQPV